MNRRSLLQSFCLLLLAPLAASVGYKPKKYYLGHNEPYDRSLVHITRDREIITGILYWEPSPGKTPDCLTGMTRADSYNPDQFHESFMVFIDKKRARLASPV